MSAALESKIIETSTSTQNISGWNDYDIPSITLSPTRQTVTILPSLPLANIFLWNDRHLSSITMSTASEA